MAGFARVCAYDRPDSPGSRSDPTPGRTAQEVVADLRALLIAAGEPGPYVLVGHSLGGLYVQLYAYQHPDEVVGLVLVNLSTANILVRLVLVAVGAMRPVLPDNLATSDDPQPSDRLRGGRLLGPMERVLILGLGLAGQLTAAGLVIAAKGLIRFPELQSKRDESTTVEAVGIDEVTEYFLVGSFVSWLLALASLALTR